MNLQERITQANSQLATYAIPHLESRDAPDTPDETRFPFQRDRDRIIHTTAFRRLKHKTQVFVAPYGDHFRTRLTHTLEVSQISRDIARTLGLNEDLAECIALAHDLGHTPFGHAGEEAMNECMQQFGKTFEHNEQSYRIVTLLEERKPGVYGLNLNREVLDGLLKHSTPHDHPTNPDIPQLGHAPSLEAQVVNLADEIAYTAHDTEDGLRAGLFPESGLREVSIVKRLTEASSIRSGLIHLLVHDLYRTFEENIKKFGIVTWQQVYTTEMPLVLFSADIAADLKQIRTFLWEKMYMTEQVMTQAEAGKALIKKLFDTYIATPPEEVTKLMTRSITKEDAVKDYIAGMTDTFAIEVSKH